MNTSELSRRIKEKAVKLGFQLAGITGPEPPAKGDFFEAWLKDGCQAGMAWMETERSRQRRLDPRSILPECRSILALACPYPAPRGNLKGGNIASYALNQDYHALIETRLKDLVQAIEDWTGGPVPNRWYVDTGPVLERELAMRAGLGWIGKNTTLINQEFGSYFFLAEILLGLDLDQDPPQTATHCGKCTSCLDACPTGALKAPYTLDARRCISYLTIEHRDSIPEELRGMMGDWVFGCDICQIVCPWNKPRGADFPILAGLQAREELLQLDLAAELGRDEKSFRDHYRGSPIKRTKRRGYLRNIALALGNQGLEENLLPLQAALQDPEPLVREAAAWAISRIKKLQEQGSC